MKKLGLILATILLMSTVCTAQYDPPTAYTTYYHLRMWDEGDRPGADSINQNLKDIDYILRTGVIHPTGFELIPGEKRFTHKIEIGTPGSSLSTDSANKIYNRTFFMSEAPRCTYNPDNTASLTNKSYVDGAITTAGADYMHIAGIEDITGVKTFQAHTTLTGGSTLYTGNHFVNRNDFTTEAPYSSFVPLSASQLANKYYVDSVNGTAVHQTGNETITGLKTFFNASTVFGGGELGAVEIDMQATDEANIQFNNKTFLHYDGSILTVLDTISASGYKLNGTTMYLVEKFSNEVAQNVYVSSTSGESPTKQLKTVDLTINGVRYKLLYEQ